MGAIRANCISWKRIVKELRKCIMVCSNCHRLIHYNNAEIPENPTLFNEDFGHVRLGQLPLLSYEYLVDENPELDDKENFKLREGAGNVTCLGGRLFGKTMIVEKNRSSH